MVALFKKIFNKIRAVFTNDANVIWGEEIPEYNPEAPFPIGGSYCELCGEVNVYDGFTQIKKHCCKKTIK